jgi:hypothetical protein
MIEIIEFENLHNSITPQLPFCQAPEIPVDFYYQADAQKGI